MPLPIHHLCCGRMAPRLGAFVYGRDTHHRHLVCHCLLVETERDGLVLVDSGMGRRDKADPRGRLGGMFVGMVRPLLEETVTAADHIEALGHRVDDVRHIVLTHLDLDHAGGLSDFPQATVHVLHDELQRARTRPSFHDRNRYRPVQWEHDPTWATYEPGGEPWFGFAAVRGLQGLPPEILMIPVAGHSAGHAAIAIDTGDRWLLHCGDAYFYRGEVERDPPVCTPGLSLFQRVVALDHRARLKNRARLGTLAREHGDAVRLFCAHDPVEYDRLAGG